MIPPPGLAPLHLLTDDRVLADPDFVPVAGRILERGGGRVALHLRGPGTGGRTLWELGVELFRHALPADEGLFVNDRIDVAMALRAVREGGLRGIHLGGRSLPASVVRTLVGPDLLLGRSVHGPQEVEAASARDHLDYLMVGTLFPTPSHPGRKGGGPERVAEVSARTSLPLIGVGGITPARAAEVRSFRAGERPRMHGVAVIRGVWNASDPAAAVDTYLDALGDEP